MRDESDEDALAALFESSPARSVHTSAAAEIAFVAGLAAVLAAPFSLLLALSGGLAVVGLVTAVIGLARSSRPAVAGGVLAALGLVLSLAVLALVGLRYAGMDTAFGDGVVPTLADWLRSLNGLVPRP
jgi:hypothetical protein